MQKEIDWSKPERNHAALIDHVRRIRCNETERELLIALLTIAHQLYSARSELVKFTPEDVGVTAKRKEIGQQINRGVRTVQRRLAELNGRGQFLHFEHDQKCEHYYYINLQAIFAAEIDERVSPDDSHEMQDISMKQDISLEVRHAQLREQFLKSKMSHLSSRVSPVDSPHSRTPSETGEPRGEPGRTRGGTSRTSSEPRRDTEVSQVGQCATINQTTNTNFSKELKKTNNQPLVDSVMNDFSFPPLEDRDFRDPVRMNEVFNHVLRAGILLGSSMDRLNFFALMLACREEVSPGGMLTYWTRMIPGTKPGKKGVTWLSRSNSTHEEAARQLIKRLMKIKEEERAGIC
ncbi:hypothetical protein Pan54_39160 [Rubinisphaera italica]|uniref:Uncharacterized protein n=2 Tax=Rubinisphaera italica TaxID=2527969 RepID=A0A5C5XL80_9PLAN|nr:hypothetical protein Pan54_39160 [Rubinisphaera italica]